jgi:hypothetical protein
MSAECYWCVAGKSPYGFIDFPDDAQRLLVMAAILIADTDSMEDLENRGNSLFLNLRSSLRLPSYG